MFTAILQIYSSVNFLNPNIDGKNSHLRILVYHKAQLLGRHFEVHVMIQSQ